MNNRDASDTHMKQQGIDTVSLAAAMDLIEICLAEGIITQQDLRSLNLSSDLLTDPTTRIAEQDFIGLWNTIAQHENSHDIALKVGQTINPNAKGLLASWISQTHTLKEALNTFIQHISLMNPSESWQLSESQNVCTLTLTLNKEKAYPPQAIERSMSAIVAWAKILSGKPIEVIETHFNFSAPTYVNRFHDIFGENIHFNSESNCLSFSSQSLQLPVISSNALLKDIIEDKAKNVLKSLSPNASVLDQVTLLIKSLINKQQTISVSIISDKLGTSRQTLYRELKKHDTDFQSIFDATRKDAALSMLKLGEDSVDTISLKLGYKDNSSFYKAFKRWYGQSPIEYKRLNIKE